MKNIIKFIVLLVVIGVFITGCENKVTPPDKEGDVPANLQGRWFYNPICTIPAYEFKTDGKLLLGIIFKDAWSDFPGDWLDFTDVGITFAVNQENITFMVEENLIGSVRYSVSREILTLSGATPQEALEIIGIENGFYYRPHSGYTDNIKGIFEGEIDGVPHRFEFDDMDEPLYDFILKIDSGNEWKNKAKGKLRLLNELLDVIAEFTDVVDPETPNQWVSEGHPRWEEFITEQGGTPYFEGSFTGSGDNLVFTPKGCKPFIKVTGGGGDDVPLIGSWYTNPAGGSLHLAFVFKTDGIVSIGLEAFATDYEYSVSENVIMVGLPDFPLGTVKYSISGNVLTTYDPVPDGLIPVPILTGTYYRPL